MRLRIVVAFRGYEIRSWLLFQLRKRATSPNLLFAVCLRASITPDIMDQTS
jgi:hypothetical protein